ncbi:MAG: response regulator [Myxococcales bacterium]
MTAGRREALLGRYRARSLERVARLAAALAGLPESEGDEERRREIARDLHTLKGDSTVVGLETLAHLAHAAEERFLGAPGAQDEAARLGAVLEVLGQIEEALRQELDEAGCAAALASALDSLRPAVGPASAGVAPGAGLLSAPPILQVRADAPGAEAGYSTVTAGYSTVAAGSSTVSTGVRGAKSGQSAWLQVQGSRVDAVCEAAADLSRRYRSLQAQLTPQLSRGALESLDRCRAALESMLSSAWSLRMVEIEPALEELVTYARELAASLGKRVNITVQAGSAEIERGVLDELRDPLLHLLRNALDHGLEPEAERGAKGPVGSVRLEVRSRGPLLELCVSDDGRGIDLNRVREAAVRRGLYSPEAAARLPEADLQELLFAHGFSTRSKASELSGRGVGLDVVRDRLATLGGSVGLESAVGRGTRFTLVVPASLTREKALLFESAGVVWGLPAEAVEEVSRLSGPMLEPVPRGQALRHRGAQVPYRSFCSLLTGEDEAGRWAVVLRFGRRRLALGVRTLLGEAELLRRPADPLVSSLAPVAGSGVGEDGRLVLLLGLDALLSRFAVAPSAVVADRQKAPGPSRRRRVLVVDDSATVRDLLCELLCEAGVEVEVACDGRAALAALERSAPDLVLTDLEMPVMDGFELLREVRARLQALPVVLLTTRGSLEDRRRATALGASAYVVKSEFDEARLLEVLQVHLGALR